MSIEMSRKELQRKIDEEVSIYQECIRELYARRNAYADISTLPQELLVDIFLLVRDNSTFEFWHRIAHVCQHWRQTAVSTPFFWTNPPTRLENYTNLMLERSKTANLNIALEYNVSIATMTSILRHIGRIQTLRLYLPTGALTGICGRLMVSDHLFLRLAHLDIGDSSRDTERWLFPSTLIQQPSSLRSLCLTRVDFDWQLLASLNLTSLHLMYGVGLTGRISGKILLETLRQMPRLQYLTLYLDRLLFRSNAPRGQVDKITLPHLHSLHVEDSNCPHVPYLLFHLVLPRLNMLKIHTHWTQDPQGYTFNAVATLATTIVNGDFRPGRRLFIEDSYIRISAFDDKELVGIQLPDYKINRGHDNKLFIRQIAPTFHNVIQVTISNYLNFDELVQVFGKMHQLRVISIPSSHISCLSGALALCSGQASSSSPEGVRLFSRLDAIGCTGYATPRDHSLISDFCNSILQNRTVAIKTVFWEVGLSDHALRLLDHASRLLEEGGICVIVGKVPKNYGF